MWFAQKQQCNNNNNNSNSNSNNNNSNSIATTTIAPTPTISTAPKVEDLVKKAIKEALDKRKIAEVYKETLNYFNQEELPANVWLTKYAVRDKDNNYTELTPNDMHHRMAEEFSYMEKYYEDNMLTGNLEYRCDYGKNRKELNADNCFPDLNFHLLNV